MRLNLGAGPEWRAAPAGWEHADRDNHGQDWVFDLAQPLSWPVDLDGIELAVMHHVLHMLDPDPALVFLKALRGRMAPGGVLRIGERDVHRGLVAHANGGQWLHDVVADDVEPTLDGKLLRWMTWHGTVRTLWSPASLGSALERCGWRDVDRAQHGASRSLYGAELDTRPWETFYVEAVA